MFPVPNFIPPCSEEIHYVIKHQSENRAVQEFRVSPQGYIYIARGNLDREKVSSYNFYLVAIDSGTPPLSSSTQVHIYVTDVNDNAPTWIFPVHNNQAINMTISEPVGYCLAKLKASDPDEGENGSVIYRLVQTSKMTNKDIFDGSAASMMGSHVNPTADAFRYQTTLEENGQSNLPGVNAPPAGNLFELDPSSGAIYVGRSMNLNDVGSVKLVVEASDGGQPAKVNHRVLQINIFRYLTQQPVFATVDTESASFNSADKSRYRLTSATNGGGHIENDLIVIIIMVAVTLIISLVLIVAILFLRCGICPNRAFGRYNSTIPNDYRPELAHPHHHLEEVFRDSGNMEVDGLLVPGLERLGNCTQFNEASLNSFQQKNENEPMCRSYLSNPGLDPWTGTTMSPKKLGQSGYETMKCNRFGGTMTFIHSPVGKPNTLRRASVINTSKRLDERIFGSPSATSSPDHEMKVMLTKRSTPRASVTVCDPFRASCSHLASARVGTPGLVVGKAEDMQSMDSGHGHSSSTENGMLSSLDPPSCRTKLQTHLSTFRCTTPQTFGRGLYLPVLHYLNAQPVSMDLISGRD
ncbi:uncharacterized protein DEA37_0010372 [Paragonimus westermani]|uniref:Cadherin domain-containing protein n=1 Tax=Paragonimus westermani TaxID=34504 RepID=A0A5J4NW79_9TREM|nr:uncharacterized protein DEA37_0010372 [Paragonimus westermani]